MKNYCSTLNFQEFSTQKVLHIVTLLLKNQRICSDVRKINEIEIKTLEKLNDVSSIDQINEKFLARVEQMPSKIVNFHVF